jgi:hypothetical protein
MSSTREDARLLAFADLNAPESKTKQLKFRFSSLIRATTLVLEIAAIATIATNASYWNWQTAMGCLIPLLVTDSVVLLLAVANAFWNWPSLYDCSFQFNTGSDEDNNRRIKAHYLFSLLDGILAIALIPGTILVSVQNYWWSRGDQISAIVLCSIILCVSSDMFLY